MKVIFLDIDGVLNDYNTCLSIKFSNAMNNTNDIEINKRMVDNLKEIIDKTGAKIVLSSSWRLYGRMVNNKFTGKNPKVAKLNSILGEYGLSIYDITPYGLSRGLEILSWMSDVDIDSYVVIDDELDELRLIPNENIIKTAFFGNQETGLTKKHVEEAINILNNTKRLVKK